MKYKVKVELMETIEDGKYPRTNYTTLYEQTIEGEEVNVASIIKAANGFEDKVKG